MSKKIGIVGSRDRDDKDTWDIIHAKFMEIYDHGDWIVSGGAKEGGDRIAHDFASTYGIPILIFYPRNKHAHLKSETFKGFKETGYFDVGAFFERNTWIAQYSDVLIATPKLETVSSWNRGMHNFIPYMTRVAKGGTEDTIKKYIAKNRLDTLIIL